MPGVKCDGHPNQEGVYKCVACGRHLCPGCVKIISCSDEVNFRICLKCGGKCVDFEKELRSRQEDEAFAFSFWTELSKVAIYPLQGRERASILLFGAWFGFVFYHLVGCFRFVEMVCCPFDRVIWIAPLYVIVPFLVVSVFIFQAYSMSLVFHIASQDARRQDISLASLLEYIFSPGPWLGAGTIAVFLWGPLGYLALPGEKNPALLCLIIPGFLAFPLIFARIALMENLKAFAPDRVWRGVRRAPLAYAVTIAGFLIAGMVVYGATIFGLRYPNASVAIFGQFLLLPAAVYSLMVAMHLLGLFGRLIE